MKISQNPIVSAPSRLSSALLLAAAGGLLAQAPASAQFYSENSAPDGDFGGFHGESTTLPLGTRQINGDTDNSFDPDYFTFTGLAGDTPYTLSISAGNPNNQYAATFQAYDDDGSPIGTAASYTPSDSADTQRSITGFVPTSGILTIGVDPQSVEGSNAAYSATLTATAAVPEPTTTALVALGGAVAALAARRRRQLGAAAE